MNKNNDLILDKNICDAIVWNNDGLLPVVVQQHDTGHVLMLAWMNQRSLVQTIFTKEAHYYSRSRKQQWRKGEISGHTQKVIEIRLDCDGDALLLLVNQTGVACHTGQRSCWFRSIIDNNIELLSDPEVDPKIIYDHS